MGGLNRIRFTGRVHGRPLAPGRYMIDVVVVQGKSHKRVGRVAVEIVRPGRRLTKAQRGAPVEVACAASASSPSLPAAAVDPRAGGGRGAAGDAETAGGGSSRRQRAVVRSSSHRAFRTRLAAAARAAAVSRGSG